MVGISKYLVGIKTTGDKQSYVDLSSVSDNKLREALADENWIYKVVELMDGDLKRYRKLNAVCCVIDLYDKEFNSIIHDIREIERSSIHLSDYVKTLKS